MNKTLVILAGGFGTRLRSILNDLPKPLADINGEPFLKYQFENWIRNGFNDFVLSLHYRADLIINFIEKNKDGLLKNCKVQYIVEETPLGTGGAIKYLISLVNLTDSFFVTNADTWIESGYDNLNQNEVCEIGLTFVSNASRYGSVLLNDQSYITSFDEKIQLENGGLISLGLYSLEKSIFSKITKLQFSLEKDLFPLLIKENKIKGSIILTKFIDIGIPSDYLEFCKLKK
jgi:D-glycero-alpha-D-manno-heptose 1-phosphate guanylyltransferase